MSQSSDDIYAVLWSGGKDSCLALWRARQAGLRIKGLLNFFDDASDRVRFHGVRSTLIFEQARALGLDLFQYGTTPDSFPASFEAALHMIRTSGYTGVIAGDIHLEDVRKWNVERAAGAGLRLVEPLWHDEGVNILRSLTGEGFRAVLTCCEDKWGRALRPGREIDRGFIDDVSQISGLDVCGERGEYHSFVFDGPLFSCRVHWDPGEIRRSNGFSQIDLVPLNARALC
jgi:diphthine-ammonia ligase